MNRRIVKGGTVALLFSPLFLPAAGGARRFQSTEAKQSAQGKAEKQTQEEAANKSKLMKSHLAKGNDAMHEAQAIRRQIQSASADQRPALLAKMNADYQTAIEEYQEALKDTRIADEDAITPLGLIRLVHDGLISEQKAVEMATQDKNFPVIVSNLGMAYSGIGNYEDAIPLLQQVITSWKPQPGTYMQLGTDLAETGKVSEATTTCGKIEAADASTTEIQGACYRNIAVVLMNGGKLADAVNPLRKATQVDPKDALAWKFLGDALSNSITTRQENGKMVYVIPPGTVEAYQQYLELEPSGPYAGQVKATLEGFAQLATGAATTTGTKRMP